MIIDYDKKYEENVKELLVELQEHIQNIDKEGYNVLTKDFRKMCFEKILTEVQDNNGKILLYKENNEIIGLIIGIVNNEKVDTYDFKAPKRGRITELVVSKKSRKKGVGTLLLNKMEEYLKSISCEDILIEAFAYNESAIKFYEKNNYHMRVLDMTKSVIK